MQRRRHRPRIVGNGNRLQTLPGEEQHASGRPCQLPEGGFLRGDVVGQEPEEVLHGFQTRLLGSRLLVRRVEVLASVQELVGVCRSEHVDAGPDAALLHAFLDVVCEELLHHQQPDLKVGSTLRQSDALSRAVLGAGLVCHLRHMLTREHLLLVHAASAAGVGAACHVDVGLRHPGNCSLCSHQCSSSLDSLYEHMTWSVSRTSVRRSVRPARSLSVVRGCVKDVQSARCLSRLSGLTVFLLCKSTKLRLLYPECICRQGR